MFPLDVRLLAGSIDSVELLVGSSSSNVSSGDQSRSNTATERLFSAPIQLLLHDVQLDVRIASQEGSGQADNRDSSHGLERDGVLPSNPDLADSILNLAEGYVHEEYSAISNSQEARAADDEDQELATGHAYNLPGAFDLPSSSKHLPNEEEQIGLVAKIIERLVARLHLSMTNLRVRIHLSDGEKEDLLDLRLANMQSTSEVKEGPTSVVCARMLVLQDLSMWMQLPLPKTDPSVPDEASTSSPASSTSKESTDSADDMAMSMAIADLRTSEVHSVAEQGSVYHSTSVGAVGGFGKGSLYHDVQEEEEPRIQEAEEPDGSQQQEIAWKQILGVISVPQKNDMRSSPTAAINVRLSTTTSTALSSHGKAASAQLEIILPTLMVYLIPEQLDAFLAWFGKLNLSSRSPSNRPLPQEPSPAPSQNLLVHIRMHSLAVYLSLSDTSITLQNHIESPVPATSTIIAVFDNFEGAYRLSTFEGKVALKNYSLSLVRSSNNPETSLQPLIMPDPDIIWSYSLSAPAPDLPAPHTSDRQSAPKGSINTTLDFWKTKLSAAVAQSEVHTQIPVLRDAVALRLEKDGIQIRLQPVHVWVDVELFQEVEGLFRTLSSFEAGAAGAKESGVRQNSGKKAHVYDVTMSTACVRLELRCPSPYGRALRAGIFTLDLHDVKLAHSPNLRHSQQKQPSRVKTASFDVPVVDPDIPASKSEDDNEPGSAEIGRLFVFHCRSTAWEVGTRSRCILALRPAGKTETYSPVRLTTKRSSAISSPVSGICSVPSLEVFLDKDTMDGLQYLADDLGQTLTKYADNKGEDSSGQPHVSGNRRADAGQSSSAITSASDSSEDNSNARTSKKAIAGAELEIGKSE